MAINPNLQSNLKSELAQGHSVGDIEVGTDGYKYRWSGEKWEKEPGYLQSADTPEYFLESLKKQLQSQMDEFNKRYTEFGEKNPFTFDEAQAKASATERYSPYYSAQLNDLLSGINRQRESTQGEQQLLADLNKIQTVQDKRALDEAVKASEEGYAGVGLFESGARRRETGMQNITGAEQATTREKQYGYNQAELGRTMGGLAQQEATGRREIGAAQTTDVESEVAKLKAEEEARYAQERAQYIGYPYITSQTGGLNDLLNYTFQA